MEGKLILRTEQKHTHSERLRLFKQIQCGVPKEPAVHITADNRRTHKHAESAGLAEAAQAIPDPLHAHLEFCLNLGERFFAGVAEDRVRAGSFTSVKGLADAITSYLPERNKYSQPYRWKVRGWNRLGAQSAHCETPSHTGQAFPWPHPG